jgi:flagellin FlaB
MKIKLLEFLKNKRGAMGIGTLIIFIAMVLVAAVAASVLINTSGFLQQKASSTGKQSTEQVASGLMCSGVTGHIDTNLDKMIIYISPNAGSAPIDLKQAKLFLTYDGKSVILKENGTIDATTGDTNLFALNWSNATGTGYVVVPLQDADKSVVNNAVINKGDVVAILVDVNKSFGGEIPERQHVSGKLQPEFGAPAVIDFTTPVAYTKTVMELQ